ncbi:hypothetical protein K7W42_07900 [Deinococcus sp. HMF7604]|uniref:hypothetical protein n=1 Tax=Deinococcus betulae TaxID=2873312 RepID=UPI001CCBBA61|nr:hypothetical protein [Deinococcus betulae]MBZ9750783.1 hypothetical protein [Deinococcus betulae]
MTADPPDAASLLADLTSRDPQRVWAASHAVIRLPVAARLPLVPHLAAIRQATDGLDLGGAFYSNNDHLRQALRTLEAARDGRCSCTLYPGYLFYNPNKEQASGAVNILSTSPPDWNMTYRCGCRVCGTEYTVEQGEYHYTWWDWTPIPRPQA